MTDADSVVIFDVGAHKREDSEFYLKLGYSVVAIEANPHLAEHLRKRFAREISAGRYTLIEKAIGKSLETITFYVNTDVSVWGTTSPEWVERNRRMGAESMAITVESMPFSEVVRQHGCPYYLKVDIEGADMLCIEGLKSVEYRPKFVSIESSKTSWKDLLREFEALEELGYTRFAVVNQKLHKNGWFKGRTGESVKHSFEEGASGPFGEHLQCEWLTKQAAIRRYARIFMQYKVLGDNTLLGGLGRRLGLNGWYDTHAMREHPAVNMR